jgi:hypothetical protein
MGSMSMSDAAPLPRLGEVFFDVRSPSRSLRISWYADTGVAVLSIWQGGTCTGSFRLPMGDLPRMIETLERGPDGQGIPAGDYPPHPAGAQPPPARQAQYPREPGHPGAAAGYDAYQAGPGSLHYLNGSAPVQYPDETGARYMDGAAPARYPDETGAGYPHGATPAHYPDETGAGHPGGPVPSGYRDAPVPPYQDEPDPAGGPYPGGKYPDDKYARDQYSGDQYSGDRYAGDPYPGDQYSRDPYPGDQYLNGAEPRDHSPRPAGIDYPQPVPGSPYGDGRPGRADEQQAPGRESVTAGPAGNGLEPLPESFPYGQPHRSHRP